MLDLEAKSDAEVVAQALLERDAFGVLIERYEAKLDRYVRRLGVGRKEDRQDVLQDIFIKVYRNLHAFDQSLSFSSWVYRIAHNETMSWFRKRKARPDHTLVDDGEEALSFVSDVHTADESALLREDQDVVRRALAELPQKYRDVLLLRFFEEKSYEEISDILHIPIGTVATLVFRAKDRLRHLLEKHHVVKIV